MSTVSTVNHCSYYTPLVIAKIKDRITSLFVPFYQEHARVQKIHNSISQNPAYSLTENDRAAIYDAFTKCSSLFGGTLVKDLTELPLDSLRCAALQMLENEKEANFEPILNAILKALNEEQIIQFSSLDRANLDEGFAKEALLKDKALKSVLYTKQSAIQKEILNGAYYFCHHLMETFISISGFSELGGRKSNSFEVANSSSNYEAKAKLELYMTMLAYPSVLFATFFAVFKSAPAAAIATGAVIAGTILMIPLYIRFLRPCPHQFASLESLNQKVIRAEYDPIYSRKGILRRIQEAFSSGKGVILTADHGMGKTTIATSFAEIVVAKKIENAPFLRNAQVFACEASQFRDFSGSNLIFAALAEKFGDHKKEFVLFIDEFAALLKEDSMRGKMDKAFLTFCNEFKNVICATTTEEFNKLVKDDKPIMRRLVHINVPPLTQDELEAALYDHLHHMAPTLMLEQHVISYIMEKALTFNDKTSQVDAAMSLLKCAITKATHLSFGDLGKKIDELKIEIACLENHLLHNEHSMPNSQSFAKYQEKRSELKEAKEQLVAKQAKLDHIRKIEAISLKVKRTGFAQAGSNSKEWLHTQVKLQILSKFIIDQRQELQLPIGINKALIESIIQ